MENTMKQNWDQILSLLKSMAKIYPKIKKNQATPSEQSGFYANLSLLNDQSDSFFGQLGSSNDSEAQRWVNKCYTDMVNLGNKELKDTKAMLRPTVKLLYEISTFKVLHSIGNTTFWKAIQKKISLFLKGLPVT